MKPCITILLVTAAVLVNIKPITADLVEKTFSGDESDGWMNSNARSLHRVRRSNVGENTTFCCYVPEAPPDIRDIIGKCQNNTKKIGDITIPLTTEIQEYNLTSQADIYRSDNSSDQREECFSRCFLQGFGAANTEGEVQNEKFKVLMLKHVNNDPAWTTVPQSASEDCLKELEEVLKQEDMKEALGCLVHDLLLSCAEFKMLTECPEVFRTEFDAMNDTCSDYHMS